MRVNYDLGTLLTNGESLEPLFEHLDQVSHIHLSEPGLAPIERRPIHRELAARLRRAGYKGFVSVEMKTQPLPVVQRVLEYVAEVFL
jgi:sugar phosphate isomerase/epimerase